MTTFSSQPDMHNQPCEVSCHGVNHRDHGMLGQCDECLARVVKVTKPGRRPYLVPVRRAVTESGRERVGYFCFSQAHECNPEIRAAVIESREARLAKGSVEKGARVEVFKGRKVPVGTVGTVVWDGEGDYGPRVGIKTDEGVTHFLAKSNVRPAE